MSTLPGILGEIAEAAGTAAALRLAAEIGGTEIEIPRNPKPNCKLASIVGIDAARAIAKEIGHGRVLIPMANVRGQAGRRARVARLLDKGSSTSEAARISDVHIRTAKRVRSRLKDTSDLPLFKTE